MIHPILKQKRRSIFLLLLVLLVIALGVSIPLVVIGGGPPTGLPGNPPSITPPPVPSPSAEELRRAKELIRSGQTDRVEMSDGSVLVARTGLATKGKPIQVAGITIQLPQDAYIEGYYLLEGYGASPPGTKIPPPPHYGIARGEGLAFVSEVTGEYEIAKGPRELFHFLIDALGAAREYHIPRSSR
jgi:hypothetical protein